MSGKRAALSFDMTDKAEAVVKRTAAVTEEAREPIGARVRKSVYRRVKIAAATQGQRLQDWVEAAIVDKLNKDGG